jgi:hypothetical protein
MQRENYTVASEIYFKNEFLRNNTIPNCAKIKIPKAFLAANEQNTSIYFENKK